MDLAVMVYRLSQKFPSHETYRLVSQMTRSSASVPGNIAEGHARASRKDYAHFPSIAKGSLMETETYLMLCVRLKYLEESEAASTLSTITETQQDDHSHQIATSRDLAVKD
jgi:four helix bundle protein